MKKFLFVDLDDTLFQTPGKCANEQDLRPAAYLKDGAACSFSTPRQRALFDMMQREMTLIPTTARNRDAMSRVDLPFFSYSIIDYGGLILEPGGALDYDWAETMRVDMERAFGGLQEAIRMIDDYAESKGQEGRARLIEDCGIPFYIVVKDPQRNPKVLERLEHEAVGPWIAAEGRDFFIHRNDNNLALLPKTLNKARAAAYLRHRLQAEHGEIMTFGMGDSKSDARFMAACDYAIIPSGTQLAALTVGAL